MDHSPSRSFVLLGSYPDSVVSFRGDLIRALVASNLDVTVMSAAASDQVSAEITSLGRGVGLDFLDCKGERRSPVNTSIPFGKVNFRSYPIARSGLNPIADIVTLFALRRAFRDLSPTAILAYTIKPIIWGAIAIRVVPKARFVAMVTGLGYAFQGESIGRRLLNSLVVALYRFALRRADAVVFQNPDNRDEFVKRRIVCPAKCHVVSGSGINLGRFEQTPLPDGPPHFLLIARLLGEKGIREYAAAAKAVKAINPEAIFSLVGPTDPSPDGIPLAEVEGWARAGTIQYHGATRDVRPFIRNCHIYCLPSYHEGMPRTILEAMAMARPILTTDVCGCRETVSSGENGWLVPKANPQALIEKMLWFIENRWQWKRMAEASRKLAVDRFDVQKVNSEMLRLLQVST
jgi:glycosyltransferase involved in cell wall biosynthesis